MGVLNQTSDGLPSVLFAIVRTLRRLGPLPANELLALCAPRQAMADDGKQGRQTLLRWTQLGLFHEVDGRINVDPDVDRVPASGLGEVRGIARVLRRLALASDNNLQLNVEGGSLASDLTLGLSWALAQDTFALPGGAHASVWPIEERQFSSSPYAFRNADRWNGFRVWAPLLGFGWTETLQGKPCLVIDPTLAVRDGLPSVFGSIFELGIDEFIGRIATILPVLDGGEYRAQVERRLVASAWTRPKPHEVSVSLSTALIRLDDAGVIRLQARADAPKRALLGRGFREVSQVSHIAMSGGGNA